jgi:hypothetical protein
MLLYQDDARKRDAAADHGDNLCITSSIVHKPMYPFVLRTIPRRRESGSGED